MIWVHAPHRPWGECLDHMFHYVDLWTPGTMMWMHGPHVPWGGCVDHMYQNWLHGSHEPLGVCTERIEDGCMNPIYHNVSAWVTCTKADCMDHRPHVPLFLYRSHVPWGGLVDHLFYEVSAWKSSTMQEVSKDQISCILLWNSEVPWRWKTFHTEATEGHS